MSLLRDRISKRLRVPRPAPPPGHMLASTPVKVHHHGNGVTELVLSDGTRRNVLGRSTISAIEEAVSSPPDGTRVIVIYAEGPDFCAGYDLREAAEGDAESLIAHESNFASLRRAQVPIIAALQGNVIGGGLELALAADVRIASPEMRMSIPANRLGLVYSLPGVRLLVDELGESMTRAMLLAGKVLDAAEAKSAGLIAEIAEREALVAEALALGEKMASWSPEATAGNRRVLDVVVGRLVDDAAALRYASFRPGGRLEGSISHFAPMARTRRQRAADRLNRLRPKRSRRTVIPPL
ncbi:MAG TPA: enoyl-CoA hydratase/isomerase family protein [Acidimicrobiales bacterium]|nr:enoyl-CoA hydratase/isomerase family protein [Acidimicrobiales bacterium]